jgi:hypothetical protein
MAFCLHCRHAERLANRDRRQKLFIKASLSGLALAILATVVTTGSGAFQIGSTTLSLSNLGTKPAAKRVASAPKQGGSAPVTLQGNTRENAAPPPDSLQTPAQPAPTPAQSAPTPAPPPAEPPAPVVTAPATTMQPPLLLRVLEGRTELGDTVFATRTGEVVVVNFDTSPMRTRRADKFDRVVRQTLPMLYGPAADTVLRAIPDGKLAMAGDLFTDLSLNGIRLPLNGGWQLTIWPETRQGRDGPLVVSYRTTVSR